MREQIAKYMKFLLPVLFFLYSGTISLSMHVHIENGVTIVHSHPYKKSEDGNQHHHASLSEIQLFHTLSTFQVADGAVATVELPFYLAKSFDIIPAIHEKPYCSNLNTYVSLRAPPAVS